MMETNRLVFKPFNSVTDFADFAKFNKSFSSLITDLMRKQFKTEEEYHNHIRMVLAQANRQDWTITAKDDNRILGFMSLSEYIPTFLATLHTSCSLEMVKDVIRNKFSDTHIYEGLKRFIKYCFEDLKLKRLGTYSPDNNKFAKDLAEKIGFKEEGFLRVLEMKLYSITDTDYKEE